MEKGFKAIAGFLLVVSAIIHGLTLAKIDVLAKIGAFGNFVLMIVLGAVGIAGIYTLWTDYISPAIKE